MILGVVGNSGSLRIPATFDGQTFESDTTYLEKDEGFSYVQFTLMPDGTWRAVAWNYQGTSNVTVGSGRWLLNPNGDQYEARALISGDTADNELSSYTQINSPRSIVYNVTMNNGLAQTKSGVVSMTIRKMSRPDYLVQAEFTLTAQVSKTF